MPVGPQRVPPHHDYVSRCSFPPTPPTPPPDSRLTELMGQLAISLNRHESGDQWRQLSGQATPPRPDLDDDVVGGRIERVGDSAQQLWIGKKVLPQASGDAHALSSSRVRSSEAGAPPVNAARSVKIASRISRVGRRSRLRTWPRMRSSP